MLSNFVERLFPKNFRKVLQRCCITTKWIRGTNLLSKINGLERLADGVAVWTGCIGVDGGEDVGVDVASGKVVRLSCVGVDWLVSAGVGRVVGGCGWWCGWVVDVPQW